MSQTGEAAEQIVNMATNVTVKGVECMTNLAGKGALSLATFLIAALKDEKRTSGKTRLRSFRGKPTSVFVIRQSELKTFAQEAKNYGVLYAAVLDKRNPDGLCDIVVSAEDASRVNRIAERFSLSTVDIEKIREDIIKAREKAAEKTQARPDPAADKPAHSVDDAELDEMLQGAPQPKQPIEVAPAQPNPTSRAENNSPSGRTLKPSAGIDRAIEQEERPSVRKAIKEIQQERQTGKEQHQQQKQQNQHIQPQKQKKSKQKSRGR